MSLEGKERVQAHIRRIQSSATSGAAAAVRPEPAQHFQPLPQGTQGVRKESPNPLEGDPNVKNGLDYS